LDIAQDAGVLERQFWRMTPADLRENVEVHRRRQTQAMERTAWLAHHVMSAFLGSKHTPTIDRLLGRVTDA
jgi:hypothetical protein